MKKSLIGVLEKKYGVSDDTFSDAVRLQKEKGVSLSEVLLHLVPENASIQDRATAALERMYGII